MNMSPQVFLDSLLRSRGYCTNKYCSLEGAYYNKPTPLQEASYGMRIAQTVRGIDASHLEKLLRCGLSPNPCNAFGESIVHMACRRGDIKILQVLLDAGSSVQVTDDFGRTPLHDACWTSQPKFDIVETIIQKDPHLINIVDCRGSSPLSYVRREHWEEWISFIQSIVNKYWPPRDKEKEGEQPPPPLTLFSPDSRPIKDPPNALSEEMAHLVSSGKVEPDDILS
jgi:ankyrin repeat protein